MSNKPLTGGDLFVKILVTCGVIGFICFLLDSAGIGWAVVPLAVLVAGAVVCSKT